jgi:hypothetical protein
MDVPKVRYGTIDPTYYERLATTPPEDDGPVWMVNLMAYRDVADYEDGRATTLSGKEADDLYAPFGPIAAVGGEIVFFADVESQLLGDAPKWDRVAVVEYPTRRAFVEMQSLPEFLDLHVHKEAGMEHSIIMGCVPFDAPKITGAPDWADVPHPPTTEDPPVMVLHVIRFVDGGIPDMTSYQDRAGEVAVPHGVRLAGWFDVDGTFIGDERSWDQARFNAFPSKEAFMAVVFDPKRLEAHKGHREPAIADTYTMILRPLIDGIAASVSATR